MSRRNLFCSSISANHAATCDLFVWLRRSQAVPIKVSSLSLLNVITLPSCKEFKAWPSLSVYSSMLVAANFVMGSRATVAMFLSFFAFPSAWCSRRASMDEIRKCVLGYSPVIKRNAPEDTARNSVSLIQTAEWECASPKPEASPEVLKNAASPTQSPRPERNFASFPRSSSLLSPAKTPMRPDTMIKNSEAHSPRLYSRRPAFLYRTCPPSPSN
mmetsp:Transcript_7246/g.17651  ORF Transcript_7246/g.17651 Transcript_7246/m.17651 type:complete len:215 (+) Transcript_7246:1832-2476(+)